MTDTKHTPGPWEFCSDLSGLFAAVNGGETIISVLCQEYINNYMDGFIADHNVDQKPSEANADLLEAAELSS
jgi:hypothetical protein